MITDKIDTLEGLRAIQLITTLVIKKIKEKKMSKKGEKPTGTMLTICIICFIFMLIFAGRSSSGGFVGIIWQMLANGGFLVFGILAIVFAVQNKKARKK